MPGNFGPSPPLSEGGRLALRVLLRTPRFTDVFEGISGETPVEVEAMRVLFREPRADGAFRFLLENGSTGGRLFALCGLFHTDPAAFEEGRDSFREDEEVEFQVGCQVVRVPARRFVLRPEEGDGGVEDGDEVPYLPDGDLPGRMRDGP